MMCIMQYRAQKKIQSDLLDLISHLGNPASSLIKSQFSCEFPCLCLITGSTAFYYIPFKCQYKSSMIFPNTTKFSFHHLSFTFSLDFTLSRTVIVTAGKL